ncbi:MAG: hypothetical protein Q7R56_03560 [Nanoarchaeota archaeon]|nr:hypothetical protein [Nanoarchaeota archaeon]
MKGEITTATLVAVIAVVIVIIFAVVMTTKLKKAEEKVQQEETCKIAIANAAYASKLSKGSTLGLPGITACQRETLLIQKKDVITTLAEAETSDTQQLENKFTGAAIAGRETGIEPPTYTKPSGRTEVLNQDKISNIIADAMGQCWNTYGEGKLDPFSQWDNKEISYCAICKTIKFDEPLKTFIKEHEPQTTASEEEKTFYREHYYPGSPALWMMTHQTKTDGPTYWEYLYHENPQQLQLTQEQIQQLSNANIAEGSHILLRMYKLEDKSTFKGWVQVGIPVATAIAGVILFVPSGGTSTILIIAATAGATVGAAVGIGIDTLIGIGYPGEEAFKECPGCNALGGMYLIPSGQALNIKQPTLINKNGKTEELNLAICDELVN